ncbi:MAG: signal peptide peptidase SppA [Pseudomonadota bacterium]
MTYLKERKFMVAGEEKGFTLWGFLKGAGKLLIGLVLLLQAFVGLALILILAAFIAGVSTQQEAPFSVPDGAALVMAPAGVLVEQRAEVDPLTALSARAYGAESPPEIEVRDFVDALRAAKDDDRIDALVLSLQDLYVPGAYASKLEVIASEIDKFKESGKKVVAVGDYYDQPQYYLASRADEVHMNPLGGVFLYGYGQYGTYYKSLLEKLEVNANVFRVGTYKAAVEPLLRDDMSPEAKEANLAFLSVLWRRYVESVSAARDVTPATLTAFADEQDVLLRAAGGDGAVAAKTAGLVDALSSRTEQRARLIELVGEDYGEPTQVGMFDYLRVMRKNNDTSAPNIGVVTAAGTILDGEQPAGSAGGDTIARLLRTAREDSEVEAVVLRVDSPGGSAFASEVIRQEVLELKKAGKPVVVSMGSLAASGGYWISAPADEIWAAPTTITGSIGIFGFIPTFEKTMAKIGVYTDGVGTSRLSGAYDPLTEMSPYAADLIQISIEDGYNKFLNIVSEGRGLDTEYVGEIAEGRVWVGEKALELKLVDNLGTLEDAAAAAARLADLDEYDVVPVRESLTPFEELVQSLFENMEARFGARVENSSALSKLTAKLEEHVAFFEDFNDPSGAYARCLACDVR